MRKLIFILILLFPIVSVGQISAKRMLLLGQSLPTYTGKIDTILITDDCDYYPTLWKNISNVSSPIYLDYNGVSPDSIRVTSFDHNYDGDTIESDYAPVLEFELMKKNPIEWLETPITFYYDAKDYGIHFSNQFSINRFILCESTPQSCKITFQVKDSNHGWGPLVDYILVIDVNPWDYEGTMTVGTRSYEEGGITHYEVGYGLATETGSMNPTNPQVSEFLEAVIIHCTYYQSGGIIIYELGVSAWDSGLSGIVAACNTIEIDGVEYTGFDEYGKLAISSNPFPAPGQTCTIKLK